MLTNKALLVWISSQNSEAATTGLSVRSFRALGSLVACGALTTGRTNRANRSQLSPALTMSASLERNQVCWFGIVLSQILTKISIFGIDSATGKGVAFMEATCRVIPKRLVLTH